MLSTVIRPIRPDLTPRLGGGCSRKGNTEIDTLFRVSVRNTNNMYCNDRNGTKYVLVPAAFVILYFMPLLWINNANTHVNVCRNVQSQTQQRSCTLHE